MTKERAEKIIENKIDEAVKEYRYQDAEYDDEDCEDDNNQYRD